MRQLLTSLGFLVGFGVGPYVPAAWQLAALALVLVVAWAVRARAEEAALLEADDAGAAVGGVRTTAVELRAELSATPSSWELNEAALDGAEAGGGK